MGLVTFILTAVDIAQAGADPLTDGATIATSADEAKLQADITTEQEAIAEFDTQICSEIQAITTEIETNTPFDKLDFTSEETSDIQALQDELIQEEYQGFDTLDSDQDVGMKAYFDKNGRFRFDNPINMSRNSLPSNMPKGVNNNIGQKWMQEIQNKGVRVEWNLDAQTELERHTALERSLISIQMQAREILNLW